MKHTALPGRCLHWEGAYIRNMYAIKMVVGLIDSSHDESWYIPEVVLPVVVRAITSWCEAGQIEENNHQRLGGPGGGCFREACVCVCVCMYVW